MKKSLLLLASVLLTPLAMGQPAPVSPEKAAIDAFWGVHANAPSMAAEAGNLAQLARQCAIPEVEMAGVKLYFETLMALGDNAYKQQVSAGYARGVQRAAKRPPSLGTCRQVRPTMSLALVQYNERARSLAGLVRHAQAVGGAEEALPTVRAKRVPPGATAPTPEMERPRPR